MKIIKPVLLISALFIFAGFPNTAHAQTPIDFGVRGGINIANISGDEFDDADSRTGFLFGAVMDISLPALPVGIETGLYYTQKGASYSESFEGVNIESAISLDYLEVPVLAKIGIGPPGPISPYIVAGPYAAYNLNAEADMTMNGFSLSVDIEDEVESMDFGLIGGAGVDFNIGAARLHVQARYSLGLTNVIGDIDDAIDDGFDNDVIDDDPDGKHRVFSIAAGITF